MEGERKLRRVLPTSSENVASVRHRAITSSARWLNPVDVFTSSQLGSYCVLRPPPTTVISSFHPATARNCASGIALAMPQDSPLICPSRGLRSRPPNQCRRTPPHEHEENQHSPPVAVSI